MAVISEVTRRRPGFQGDAPIVMADGQVWYLPKPRVRFTTADGERGYRAVLSAGDDHQDLLDRLQDAHRAHAQARPRREEVHEVDRPHARDARPVEPAGEEGEPQAEADGGGDQGGAARP